MSVLSNIGWACVQINHLALIPQITANEDTRTQLVGLRQSFVYISTITVLLCASVIFPNVPDSVTAFALLATAMICLGFGCCLFFLCTVNEVALTKASNVQNAHTHLTNKTSAVVQHVKW